MKPFLAAACLAMVALSCAPDEDDEDGRTGFARAAVKTGRDEYAGKVEMVPRITTIAALCAIPVPSNLDADSGRFTHAGSPEIQSYRLTNVLLAAYKLESDGDYHLVLEDGAGNRMIAEIADPRRVTGSWKARATRAREAFDARHSANGSFQGTGETVTVTGVGFFDLLHGQIGAAPNGIEIHAVLDICWGRDCAT